MGGESFKRPTKALLIKNNSLVTVAITISCLSRVDFFLYINDTLCLFLTHLRPCWGILCSCLSRCYYYYPRATLTVIRAQRTKFFTTRSLHIHFLKNNYYYCCWRHCALFSSSVLEIIEGKIIFLVASLTQKLLFSYDYFCHKELSFSWTLVCIIHCLYIFYGYFCSLLSTSPLPFTPRTKPQMR